MDIQLFKLETEYIVGLAVQTLTSDLLDKLARIMKSMPLKWPR